MQSELRMERRRLSDLLPAEYNPRVTLGPEDKEFQDLVTSIRTLGYAEPILINEDGTIIGGHQRYNALLYLGWEEADVVVYPCSKVKEKALNVALNKIDGRWDASDCRSGLLARRLLLRRRPVAPREWRLGYL